MTRRLIAWITGAGGLIGNQLVCAASLFAPGWEIHAPARSQLDLTDIIAVRETFHRLRPQIVIHCAALSKTGACERNPALARRVNVQSTAQLAELAEDIPFIFFSTDLVFDGRRGHYDETHEVNPLSVYAETKVMAEHIVLKNPRHTVIRTSLNGGISPTGDRSFNEEMRRAWQAGKTLNLFTDEFRCPIPAKVTARAVWELIQKGESRLYHLAGAERLSRWQVGQLFAKRWPHLHPKLTPSPRETFAGPPRPADTSLNCTKAQARLSFPLPRFTDWLNRHPAEEF